MKIKKVVLFLTLFAVACTPQDRDPDLSGLDLQKYPKEKLAEDFNLLVSSLKEAHTGLYWYSTKREFDSLVSLQKSKIKADLNGLQFYNVIAPVVAFTKEDHCDISVSEEVKEFLESKGKFLPLVVIHLNEKAYILNNPWDTPIKGHELVEINGQSIREIRNRIFNTFASDGYILSSKFRYLDFQKFSVEYAKVVSQPKEFQIKVLNPKTNKKESYRLNSVNLAELDRISQTVQKENKIKAEATTPASLEFTEKNTAILTLNTFSNRKFRKEGMVYKSFIDSAFKIIRERNTRNLIIDIRNNGGGSEGNEDYLFSFLTRKPYQKYKFVEASNVTFSFLKYTDYADTVDKKELEQNLRSEHYLTKQGRLLRKAGISIPEPLKLSPFIGNIFILTSGWTYSGGAEFASLMREHTNAVFIGEEVGGGYYGNTSGYIITLTLPHTQLPVEIPLLKFVLNVNKGTFGRGIIPQYKVQPTFEEFIRGYDAELEFVKRKLSL